MPHTKAGPFVTGVAPALNAGHMNVLDSQYDDAMADVAAFYGHAGYDIVILAGQSNMSGYSEAVTSLNGTTLDRANGRIMQWGTHGTLGIKSATEPLDMYDTPPGIGPGLQFARWYAMQHLGTGRNVLLVPVAKGGTCFEGASNPTGFTWKVGRNDVTNLYSNMITTVNAAKAAADAISGTLNQIVALLWLQGETDGDNATAGTTYRTDLDALISHARTDLGVASLPIIVGTMVPEYLSTGTRKAVDAVHRSTPLRWPSTDVAVGPSSSNMGDGNHYNQAAQRLLGLAFFNAYQRIAQGVAPTYTDYTPAQVTSLSVTSSSTTSLSVAWGVAAGANTYLVEYRLTGGSTWTTATTTGSTSTTISSLTFNTSYDVRVTTINVIGDSASPSAVVTGTPGASAAVSDTFTRANSSSSLGTADTGQAWTAGVGTFGITSNTAYPVSAADGDRVIINAAKSDQVVSVTVTGTTPGSSGPNPSVLARMTDANNGYLVAFIASASTIKLFKIVAGVYTQIGGNVSATMTDGQTLGITVTGTSISAVLNGTTVLTVTDSTFTTGTYAGLRVGAASTAIRYDNFSVQ